MMRDNIAKIVSEFDSILSPGGRIIYLGTPQTEDSIYNKLPNRGYIPRIWPARVPTAEQIVGYGGKLAPFILELCKALKAGAPVEPTRFDEQELAAREASYARSGFNLQFMLDTSLSDANKYPLKLSDLIVEDLDNLMAPNKLVWSSHHDFHLKDVPAGGMDGDYYYSSSFKSTEWSEYDGAVMSIDPSGRGADETGYAIVKHLNGMLFVMACGGIDGGYDIDTLNKLASIAKSYNVNEVIVESNFGDGMFNQLFSPVLAKHHACTLTEVRHNIQKEKRIIDTLEPLMNQHRIIFNRKLILNDFNNTPDILKQLGYQLTRITKERGALRHDDRIDALSIAVNHWVQYMNQNIDDAADLKIEAEFNKELDAFINGAVGYSTGQNFMRLGF